LWIYTVHLNDIIVLQLNYYELLRNAEGEIMSEKKVVITTLEDIRILESSID
jgi:hypothetical protein